MRLSGVGAAAAIAVIGAASAHAASEPWDGVPFAAPAAEVVRAAQALPPAPAHPVTVLLSETELRLEADGRCVRRDRQVYRVESDKARDAWGTVEVTWAPWHQARPEVQARVIGRDGRESTLDAATLVEAGLGEIDDQVFSDRKQLSAPLPALAPGAVVETQTVVRDEAPWFAAGTVTRLYLGGSPPTRRARVVVDHAADLPVRWTAQLLPGLQPRREENGGRVRLVFEQSDIAPFESPEPGLPPDVAPFPSLLVSTASSWNGVARAFSDLVERQLKAADVSAMARAAVDGAHERRAVVQRLLARVDDVRYTSVLLGDAAFVPRTPQEVLARRYGDCKDKATLLVALLRASGVPASVALLSSGYGADVPEDLPGLGQFNHAIVHVPGPPEMWVDPTLEHARAGELPLNDQGRWALVAAADTKGLVRTPEGQAAENGTVQTREFHLAELGPARVTEAAEYRGAWERYYRQEYAGGDAARRREQVEDYVRKEYLADSLATFTPGPVADLDRPFRVTLEALRARRGATDEKESLVAYFPGRVTSDLPDALLPTEAGSAPPARKGPFYFATPHFVEHRYRIVPPDGYAIRELPAAEDLALGPARYRATWAREPNGVVAGTLRFESGPRRITPEQFQEMREAVRTLRARPAAFVRFTQTGEACLAEGRVRDALQEFGALSARHPKEALHHTQVALAVLSGGLGEAAREEAQRAVAIEPGSSVAYRRLGWVLQHDLVGRHFGTGADVAGAQAAHRKAVELAPDDVQTRASLAYVLEYGPQGERFGPDAKLAEAAEQYWHLAREDHQPSFDLALVLFRAGRYGEMAEAARLFEDQSQRDSVEVLAAAAQDGAKAGIARAARIPKVDDRRRILQETADQMVAVRRYADAAALLQESAAGSPNAASMRGRIDLLGRMRPDAASDGVEPGPVGVVRTLLRGLFFGWSLDRMMPLFHPDERGDAGMDADGQWQVVRGLLDGERRKVGIAPAVFADLALSGFEVNAEGDDRFGYRVRLRGPAPGVVPTLYVVKHGGGHVILGSAGNLDALAREVLRRADANDAEGARRLLDWAREETSADGEDPFAVSPLVHFWTVGQTGGLDQVRIAAAGLLVGARAGAERGVQILTAGRGLARDAAQRAQFDHALLMGYATLDRWADALAAADRLAGPMQTSPSLRTKRDFALFRNGRVAELQRSAEERLRAQPADVAAARSLRLALVGQKQYAAIATSCGAALQAAKVAPADYNDCAWNALFLPPPRAAAVAWARRGVELAGAQRPRALLHTLATLYASEDQTTEAYGVMLDAMKAGPGDEPRPEDWIVFGRIAESYGLPEAAAAAYRRVPKSDEPASTWSLAQQRLAALPAPTARKAKTRP